jgi:hemoglobin-like flavoprotein
MTEQQIQLVKKTWMIFQKIDPVLVGEVFYDMLFTEYPSFKRMFATSKQTQSKKIIAMLNLIVAHIDSIEDLSEELRNLAVRHVYYGVKPEYYRPVGIALLWMLKQGLGNDWNEKVKEAWHACYQTIAAIMIESKVK